LKLVERHLKTCALVIGEHAVEKSTGFLDYGRNPKNGYLVAGASVPSERRNDLTVVTR
jgi:hypothetical protein